MPIQSDSLYIFDVLRKNVFRHVAQKELFEFGGTKTTILYGLNAL